MLLCLLGRYSYSSLSIRLSICLFKTSKCLLLLDDSYALVALHRELPIGSCCSSFQLCCLLTLKLGFLLFQDGLVDLVEVSVLFVEPILVSQLANDVLGMDTSLVQLRDSAFGIELFFQFPNSCFHDVMWVVTFESRFDLLQSFQMRASAALRGFT